MTRPFPPPDPRPARPRGPQVVLNRARLYNFSGGPLRGAARFWQLRHGRYRLRQGADVGDDGRIDGKGEAREVVIQRGRPLALTLSATGQVIELELRAGLPPLSQRANLALSPLDIVAEGSTVEGCVHNTGNRPAPVEEGILRY